MWQIHFYYKLSPQNKFYTVEKLTEGQEISEQRGTPYEPGIETNQLFSISL
jgi:hypothetical protein